MTNRKEFTPLTISDKVQPALVLDDEANGWQFIANLALLGFLNGEQPYLRQFQANGVVDPEAVLPDEGTISRHLQSDTSAVVLLTGEGWTGTINVQTSGYAFVQVTAISDELAKTICKEIKAKVPATPRNPDLVRMTFWHHNHGTARQTTKQIEAPGWTEIEHNYAATARAGLERLVALKPPTKSGRLILLHGEPGTGKTTALRALARAWKDWCRTEYVIDADRLFGVPSYLLEVVVNQAMAATEADDSGQPWRLLIVEDCDELIRADAKHVTGQALSRLLNVTDGILGQGLKVLFCITTNEDLSRLHPAVTRPGRCLANIPVDRFSKAEALDWLGETPVGRPAPAEGATLAELFALTSEQGPLEVAKSQPAPGQYL